MILRTIAADHRKIAESLRDMANTKRDLAKSLGEPVPPPPELLPKLSQREFTEARMMDAYGELLETWAAQIDGLCDDAERLASAHTITASQG